MSWHCYLVRCADDTLYAGVTNDLDRRVAAHNDGTGARYTRGRGPVTLVFTQRCKDRSAALRREVELTRLTRAEKEQLVTRWAARKARRARR